jgi:hypothetical protein
MTPLKSRQFCSVCKQWLEMEVVPTSDGDDDDGVIWFRCPQCQGYLPKLGGADLTEGGDGDADPAGAGAEDAAPAAADDANAAVTDAAADDDMPWDSPAEMMAARDGAGAAGTVADEPDAGGAEDDLGIAGAAGDELEESGADADDADDDGADAEDADTAEPLAEYAAQLAALDPGSAVPYRPWDTYELGQCILHLAWDDCGVVVGKEDLPGGRKVIKCYFAEAGVVRLIENSPR